MAAPIEPGSGATGRAVTAEVEPAIWEHLGGADALPDSLGSIDGGTRSEPLAIVQQLLLYHLLQARKSG